jgi:Fe-Mn family superoxide dismutase
MKEGHMFTLPDLAYSYDALEPYIDAQTMEIHHSKHHATYVSKLNDALKDSEWANQSIEDLLQGLDALPESIQTSVRNNGGGHYNHSLFWQLMSPDGGGMPNDKLHDMIVESFGSFEEFKKQFTDAAIARFGSGWAWLIRSGDKLEITSTPNQDSPMMEGIAPLLGLDVWEHAYYLKYQNRRPDYIDAWWNVVDWQAVQDRL